MPNVELKNIYMSYLSPAQQQVPKVPMEHLGTQNAEGNPGNHGADYSLAFHDCVSDSVRSLSLMHEGVCFVWFSIFCAGIGCSRCVLFGFV